MKYTAIVNGKTYEVEIVRTGSSRSIGHSAPTAAPAFMPAPVTAPISPTTQTPVPTPVATPAPAATQAGNSEIVSPMPGSILDVLVKTGDAIEAGQIVVMLEAMKMEIEVRAEQSGTVSHVAVKKGDAVESGTLLVKL